MTYVVQPGDSLYLIAQKFNTSLDAIIAANPQIRDPNLIFPGQRLNIPIVPSQCPVLRQGDRGPDVQRFQRLLSIAGFNPGPLDGIFGPRTQSALVAFQNSQRELEVTGIADLETWVALGAECDPRPEVIPYTVRPGDTLFIIATRFNTTVNNILRINPLITDPNNLRVGQFINIPVS